MRSAKAAVINTRASTLAAPGYCRPGDTATIAGSILIAKTGLLNTSGYLNERLTPPEMAFFAIIVPFVVNTTVLDRQQPAGLREVLRSSHESVHAAILNYNCR